MKVMKLIECQHPNSGNCANCSCEESPDLTGLLSGWISVDDELPAIGESVILFANGVVQHETYQLDAHDSSDFHVGYFWARDELDECPEVKAGQCWMRLPEGPAR